jgi:hypothetical protein
LLSILAGASLAFAQDAPQEVTKLVGSTADPDGSHTLTFARKDGASISLKIPPAIAVSAISALSQPTGNGPKKQQVVVVVRQVTMGVNEDGTAIVIAPQGQAGPLEPLGIPVSGAENFINLFQEKLGLARKRSSQPK